MATPPRFQGLPEIIYGTAFKFERSATLVAAALKAGFRAVDTSGSLSAYRETLVGDSIKAALASGSVERSELYVQTKFSPFKEGKDPALYPYDVTKPIPEQVTESIASSLKNLGVSYIDCLVLHSLYPDIEDTLIAWKAMSSFVPNTVGSLCVSNTDLATLQRICNSATIQPISVQNRFTKDTVDKPTPGYPNDLPYPIFTWDRDVRGFCREKGIAYAPWGILWGSLDVLDGEEKIVEGAAKAVGISREIACYALMRSLRGCRVCLLCGTTNEGRMVETLDGLRKVERFVGENEEQRVVWMGYVDLFRAVVDGDEVSA